MAQLAAFNTMTAIKKKLHGMKQKREEAFDRADQLEQKLIEHRAISEKVSLLIWVPINIRRRMLFYRNWICDFMVSHETSRTAFGLEFIPELLLICFIFSLFHYFYRTMLSRARYCHGKSFVRLSVLLSVSDVEISWPAQCLE